MLPLPKAVAQTLPLNQKNNAKFSFLACRHQWVERSGPKLEQVPKDEQFRLDKRYDFGHYTLTSVLTALLSDPMAGLLKLVSSFG